jgi:hypothetical protein
MRHAARACAVSLLGLSLAAPPVAAKSETVTGRVVDLTCLNLDTKANAGKDHVPQGRECAWACIKWWGQPVGILTADGRIYQLAGGLVANNNEKIAEYVAQTVRVTGDVAERDGILMLTADGLTVVQK